MITFPSSLQELVGRRLKRISISDNRQRIIFDTWPSRTNQTSRYAYSTTNVVDRFQNYSSMVGYTITAVVDAGTEVSGQHKLVIRTNAQDTFGVIYFSAYNFYVGLASEDSEQLLSELSEIDDCLCFVTEESGILSDVVLEALDLGRGPPYRPDSDNNFYIVEEGDVTYSTSLVDFDCGGDCGT